LVGLDPTTFKMAYSIAHYKVNAPKNPVLDAFLHIFSMFSCGFPFIFYTCITLDCLEIESPFQRQWIRRTESIPLGLRGRTNFAAGPIKATSCTLLLKVCSSCSQDGRAGEDAARHERCWLSPPTFPSFPWLFLRSPRLSLLSLWR